MKNNVFLDIGKSCLYLVGTTFLTVVQTGVAFVILEKLGFLDSYRKHY